MARIRTIKPEFFTSLTVAGLPPLARLTFVGLWTHVDDAGRCIDEPRLIKAAVWPLDDRGAGEVEDDLRALAKAGLVLRYTVAGRAYLAVTNWAEHQSISKPTPSKLPAPSDATLPDPGGLREDSRSDPTPPPEDPGEPGVSPLGKERNREQGKEEELTSAAEPRDADEVRPDVARLCEHLADRIEANGSKRPAVGAKWRTAARLMLDADGRTEAQVHTAIDWCQDSDFWRGNVLSMPKLRDKYDQLRLQAQRATAIAQVSSGPPGSRPSTTDQRVQDALSLAAQMRAEQAGETAPTHLRALPGGAA